MKDPDSERKMEEYSSSSKEDDEDEDEDEDEVAAVASIVKWLLKNGYVIGRRMIVTGIMISSATLVVPPLVAFSAMGVVISAPFGFLFGTYACTNNLITIFLPDPDQLDAAVEDDYGPDVKGYYSDEEDKEQTEGINHRVEIELDDYKQAALTEGNFVKSKDEGMVIEDDNFVRETSSFGDVKDVETTEPVTFEEKDIEHEEDMKQRIEMIAGDEQGYVEDDDDDDNSLEEENKSEELLVNDKKGIEDDHFGDDNKDVETTKPVTVKEIETQKLVAVGSKNNEPVGEMHHVVILSQGNDENNYNSRQVEELDLVATNKDKNNIESDEKMMRQSMGTLEINGDNNGYKEETLNHSNADSLEVGDDERKTNINLGSLEVDNVEKEDASDINVDVLLRSPLKQAPLDIDNAEDASKAYKKMPSKEDDERMWEKIKAMRRIVGYKAPSEATCIGELKALYVFTGVEPPALSDEGDSDLDDKLNFLMAIIGVK